MSDAKKWHVDPDSPRRVLDGNGFLVSRIAGHFDHYRFDNDAAHALLFAKAPELLEMLERLVDDPESSREDTLALWDEAAALIAEAKGD
jgi:predicted metal-dependent hydrolase